jgi:hypothetical protein
MAAQRRPLAESLQKCKPARDMSFCREPGVAQLRRIEIPDDALSSVDNARSTEAKSSSQERRTGLK